MSLLYLIRHARSTWNASGRMQGWADPPLDDIGRQQVQALARRLRNEKFAAIYSSPLIRARETAEALATQVGLDVCVDERLKERHMGAWTGLTGDEAQAQYPSDWADGWRIMGAPGGESQIQLSERAQAVFADITAAHPQAIVAVVSHGGTLNTYLSHLIGIPPEERVLFAFPNTGLARVSLREGRVRILSVGDDSHWRERN